MQKTTKTVTYSKGELVWAKIRGYPWWPGIVSKIVEEKQENGEKRMELVVNFIGENSHSKLQLEKVAKYEAKYQEFTTNIKQKKLLDSIKTANQINEGKTTYDAEIKKLQKQKIIRRIKKEQSDDEGENDSNQDPEEENQDPQHKSENESSSSSNEEEENEFDEDNLKTAQSPSEVDDSNDDEGNDKSEKSKNSTKSKKQTTSSTNANANANSSSNSKKSVVTKAITKKKLTKTRDVLSNNPYATKRTQLREPMNKAQKFQHDLKEALRQAQEGLLGDLYNLDTEFNTLLSSLINNHVQESHIEDAMNKIIAKIHTCCPQPSNIQKILQNDNGKSLVCLKQLLDEKRTLLENLNVNVGVYVTELESIINTLRDQLLLKYFDHSERLSEVKQIMKSNGPQKYKKELSKLQNNGRTTNQNNSSDNETEEEEEMDEEVSSNNSFNNNNNNNNNTASTTTLNNNNNNNSTITNQTTTANSNNSSSSSTNKKKLKKLNQVLQRQKSAKQSPLMSSQNCEKSNDSTTNSSKFSANNNNNLSGSSPVSTTKEHNVASTKENNNKDNITLIVTKENSKDNNKDISKEVKEIIKEISKETLQLNVPALSPTTTNQNNNNNTTTNTNTNNNNNNHNNHNLIQNTTNNNNNSNSLSGLGKELESKNLTLQRNLSNVSNFSKGSTASNQEEFKEMNLTSSVSLNNANTGGDKDQKENIKDPNLRKKVCKKMYEILKESYDSFPKKEGSSVVLQVEKKIRNQFPKMCDRYREKIVLILKIIKSRRMSQDELIAMGNPDQDINFDQLNYLLNTHKGSHSEPDLGLKQQQPANGISGIDSETHQILQQQQQFTQQNNKNTENAKIEIEFEPTNCGNAFLLKQEDSHALKQELQIQQ